MQQSPLEVPVKGMDGVIDIRILMRAARDHNCVEVLFELTAVEVSAEDPPSVLGFLYRQHLGIEPEKFSYTKVVNIALQMFENLAPVREFRKRGRQRIVGRMQKVLRRGHARRFKDTSWPIRPVVPNPADGITSFEARNIEAGAA